MRRDFFDEKIRYIANLESILDLGSGRRFQKQLAPYRQLFQNKKYVTVDLNPETKPDIAADVHQLPLSDASFEAALCYSVLEHCRNPFLVMEEIYRVLKPQGVVLIYVPFLYLYHGNKQYGDYWRFTEDGVRELCKKFKEIEMVPARPYFEAYFHPVGRMGLMAGRILDFIAGSARKFPYQTSGWYVFLKK